MNELKQRPAGVDRARGSARHGLQHPARPAETGDQRNAGLMVIRTATRDDDPGVRVVLQRAFGTDEEADLVRVLQADGDVITALVAVADDQIVGHVLFSRLTIRADRKRSWTWQRSRLSRCFQNSSGAGIGTALIAEGLRLLRDARESAVIVAWRSGLLRPLRVFNRSRRHAPLPLPRPRVHGAGT